MNDNIAQPASTDAVALKWGIITALVTVILSTVMLMFMTDSMMTFWVFSIVLLAVPIILYGIGAAQQRKALGGYIELKEAFRAVFIMILINVVVSTIYGYIYKEFIDPEYIDRLRTAMTNFIDNAKIPKDKADEMYQQFDQKMSQQSSLKATFMNILIQIIVYSIFGFIIAAIVKKKRPVAGQ